MNDRQASVHAAITALQHLTQLFGDRRAQLAETADLTEQQWQVLEEIATDHFMPSMFARTRDSSAPAVSRTLRQLLEKDLVAVSVSPDDGRQRKYGLTPRGTRTMARLRAARQDAIDAIWMDLHPAHVRAFTRFARKLSDRLERYLVDTGGPSSARPLRGLRASDAPGPRRPSVAPRGAGLLLDQRD